MRAPVLVFLSCSLPSWAACEPVSGLLVGHNARAPRDASVMDAGNPSLDATTADAAPSPTDAAVMTDAGSLDAALDAAIDAGPRDPGMLVGNGVVGYYYAALQGDFPTGTAAPILNTSCGILIPGGVTVGFADAICIEGVGKLSDGRVLQFAAVCSQCTNAHVCPANVRGCFYLEDPVQAPWGRGSSGRALIPLRSIAVDPNGPLRNKVLYLAALDGLNISASASTATFIHDGCVRADDTGTLSSLGFRLFTGDETQYLALNAELSDGTATTLHEATPHCQGLAP